MTAVHSAKTATCTSCSAFDYARSFVHAMSSNPQLRCTPELNQLKLCRCYRTQDQAAGFAISTTGCIISMFTSSTSQLEQLQLELNMIDQAFAYGAWRVAE